MKKSSVVTYALIAVMICIGAVVGLSGADVGWFSRGGTDVLSQPQQPAPEEIITVPEDSSLKFVAAGDNLIHDVIYLQAKERSKNGGYDFGYPYENILDLIPQDGVNFINQETVLASDIFPLSNYPLFNSPTAVGDKLVDMGFNAVNHANNHMFDKWEQGLNSTMNYWSTKPVTFMGAWKSKEEMAKPIIITKNGIKIGFVPITEHTNGISLAKDSQINYLLTSDLEGIKRQVELTKEEADYTIVSVHWGEENVSTTTPAQDALALQLADMGVDLVLGHHSHTVAPIKWLEGKAGNKTLVVYSLGNFISAMADQQNMLGGVLGMEIIKDGITGEIAVRSPKLIPIVTHYEVGYRNLRLYTLEEYTQELAAVHGVRGRYKGFSKNYLQTLYDNNIVEEFRP